MGDMFRSEKMALCQMFIQAEAAYDSIAELGEIGCVQFRDLNSDVNIFQRRFVSEVRRCDELQRRIRYIEQQLEHDDIQLPPLDGIPSPPNPRQIIDLEAHLELVESEIRELSENNRNLQANYRELLELQEVLQKAGDFFTKDEVVNVNARRMSLAVTGQSKSSQLSFVAGVIDLERFFGFERMLWRISRGNVFLRRSDLSKMPNQLQIAGEKLKQKTVFVAFFQGDELKQRVKKICAGYHASLYPCPSAYGERAAMLDDVRTRLADLSLVLNQTAEHRNRVLVAASRNLPTWLVMLKKMKAIYHILNMFDVNVSDRCLIGEGWVPVRDFATVQDALNRGSKSASASISSFINVMETREQPPTYTRTNKFTRGFQNLIDAYGVASYREVNPALYTCITFPFLFAVMFGDFGHALMLTIIALWMVLKERQLSQIKGEIWGIFFGGRYIILLMGLFAIYTGLIYNDIFSKSVNIFGSGWRISYNKSTVLSNKMLQLNPEYHHVETYAFGMDPIWQLAANKILFQNSFKMKLSIIFGVVHMLFGIFMSLINFCYFKKWASVLLEFLPQVLFLVVLFGYMCFMIFYKWAVYSAKLEPPLTPGCAPSVLILFINMMLFNSRKDVPLGCEEFMFEYQNELQYAIVAAALICIPWMLMGKPLFVQMTRKTPHEAWQMQTAQQETSNGATAGHAGKRRSSAPRASLASNAIGGHGSENEPMGEIWIQQAIHTIEFVLGTVSHTASYLRLWALSLAHAQLAEVLWSQILRLSFMFSMLPKPWGYVGVPFVFMFFAVWAFFTFAILVIIEGLSAFLHTLRLHWVEFMSKFYEGMGQAFVPFSFRALLASEEE